jgi:hypothetical protein
VALASDAVPDNSIRLIKLNPKGFIMSITTVHHQLPTIVSKQILKSMIGSLNATAIAYARGHLRFNAVENIADRKEGEAPTIDDYNDAQNAVEEANFRNTVVADGMGFEVQMQSGELAERLMNLRNWYADQLVQLKSVANDEPLTIAETVKFQMDRQPDSNDTLIEALAAAVDIDAELLKAAQLKMVVDDAADLRKNAGKVITFLEQFQGEQLDETEIEASFDALPAHVQYKLMSAAIRAHDKAQQKAMIALLRGKLDAAGDIKMLKGHRAELVLWLSTFSKVKRVQLDAYLERGGILPELEDRTIVGAEPVKKVAPVDLVAPATIKSPKMKRAPKPVNA